MEYKVLDLGLIDYDVAYEVQKDCVKDVIKGGAQCLIFCQHPLVLTMGRLASDDYVIASEEELQRQNVTVHHIDRGGEVTLHTPGQMVVYPILDLNYFKKDLHHYMYQLEEVVIDLLGEFDIVARREKNNTGVWIDQKKLASIGIGVKKWVTFHGVGVNVNTNLDDFKLIKPCGLNVMMTSIADVLQSMVDHNKAQDLFIHSFNKIFETNFIKES